MTISNSVNIKGIGPVLFEHSLKARRINISVRPFGGVRVAVPKDVSFRNAERIVLAKSEWIKKKTESVKELERRYGSIPEDVFQIYRKTARKTLLERLSKLAVKNGYTYNKVFIRNQKTRWGSCSVKNNINLNMRLLMLPRELMDYVILHELVHTRVKNHGKHFWTELLRAEPEAGHLETRLKKLGILLSLPVTIKNNRAAS